MMFPVYNCIIFLVWIQYQFLWPLSGLELILDRIHVWLVGTVIRSRNVGRQMAVVETWMEVRVGGWGGGGWGWGGVCVCVWGGGGGGGGSTPGNSVGVRGSKFKMGPNKIWVKL